MFQTLGALATRLRWVILGGWLVAAAVLNVAVPQLSTVIQRDTVPFLPDSSAVMTAYRVMGEKFDSSNARGQAIVVMENGGGLSQRDEAYHAALVRRIESDHARVAFVQDQVEHAELHATQTSRDGKAEWFVVGLRAPVGTPRGDSDATWLRSLAASGRPADLAVHITGDTGIIADFQASVQQSTTRTTAMTIVLVMIILLVIYRSPVTPVIPMATIGLALGVARPLVALLGLHVFKVAAFTDTFLIAIVFGAGTDYCIFLISRFKEQMAHGEPRPVALATGVRRVGEAITCSAATVVVGGLAMLPANVSLFSTTGPAIAVAVVVTLIAGLTLTPALIAIGGDRFFWPQRIRAEHVSRFWSGAADLIARRPGRVLGAALVPLLLLAALYPTMHLTYDERSPQPQGNDSMVGLTALDRHFPRGSVLPDYVVVRSDHDLRNPRDLAVLDTVTRSLQKVEGVVSVRSFTQPGGGRIEQASIPYQVGVVAQGLDGARGSVAAGQGGMAKLNSGAQQLSDGSGQLASGAQQAQGATQQLLDGMAQEHAGLQSTIGGTSAAQDGATRLRDGAAQLATGLRGARDGVQAAVDGMSQVLLYFASDPQCAVPGPCQQARDGLRQVRDAERDQLLPGLDQAITASEQIASGDGDLATGMAQLHDGLVRADSGMQQLQVGERTFQQKMGELAGGAAQLHGGAAQLSGGLGTAVGGTSQLGGGLGQAADFLGSLSRQARDAGLDTFFVPADKLDDPRFALSRYYYLSSDGTTARLLVTGGDDAFSTAAMDRVQREHAAVDTALRGTPLAGSTVFIASDAALNADLRTLFAHDFTVVSLAVMVGVLLVLALLLRSLLAPIYLLASVLLSYGAAMGITTFVWQDLLHKGAIDWTVGIFAFIMLVSVGADYNIFLMSRVREEVRRDPVDGIKHAVMRTGAIITSAGVIFAGTFAALVISPLSNIAETGFAITCGLLLDTFIVRSFLVPSVAVLLGRFNWWPGTPRAAAAADRDPIPNLGAGADGSVRPGATGGAGKPWGHAPARH